MRVILQTQFLQNWGCGNPTPVQGLKNSLQARGIIFKPGHPWPQNILLDHGSLSKGWMAVSLVSNISSAPLSFSLPYLRPQSWVWGYG